MRGGDREEESEGDKGRREGGGAIARFQLPFVGLSADVTSCSPARRVPERGTSPPAPSSATFQVSIRQEGLGWGGAVTEGWRTGLREAGEMEEFSGRGCKRGPTDWAAVTVLRTVPAICH